jgi:protein gp37
MNKTKIEWVKNPDGTQGYSWNPITGCLNGCSYCYARKLAERRLKSRYLANKKVAPLVNGWLHKFEDGEVDSRYDNPFYPREWFDRRERALENKKPKGVFTCDMSDLFGKGIPESWTECVLETIKICPEHRFYLLTKQPQNLAKWSPFPDNCWVGVSVTGKEADGFAYPLTRIKAKVKFLSIEPLLAPIKIGNNGFTNSLQNAGISWLIIGQQTPVKQATMPKIEWIKDIVEASDTARIPVFLKNKLQPLLQQNGHNIYSLPEWAGKQFAVTGDHLLEPSNPHPNEPMRQLRQEFPS